MTIFVFTALLGAAFFHASWNALVKNSADKIKSMLVLTLVHGILGIFVAFFVEFPKLEVWPWLITSAIFHVIYQGCLALAYNSGDLSRVYPIARGTAPILVLLIFYFIIETSMTHTEILGVLLLGFGVIGMAQGAFSNRENLILLPYTLGAAIGTAGYTIFDGIGSRISTDPSSYIAWLFIITVPIFFSVILICQGLKIFKIEQTTWKIGSVAGILSFGSYWVAIWAMTQAPIPLVAALRETSILFAVLIGIIIFRDKTNTKKIIAASLILAGIIIVRL